MQTEAILWLAASVAVVALVAVLLIRRRNAETIARSTDYAVRVRNAGTWKEYFTNVPEAVPLRGVFTFSYDDGDGSCRERTVEALMPIPRPDRMTLFGRCHESNEHRHFNLARVTKMVDAERGESIERPELELLQRCRASQ